jgi:hypothetical protein
MLLRNHLPVSDSRFIVLLNSEPPSLRWTARCSNSILIYAAFQNLGIPLLNGLCFWLHPPFLVASSHFWLPILLPPETGCSLIQNGSWMMFRSSYELFQVSPGLYLPHFLLADVPIHLLATLLGNLTTRLEAFFARSSDRPIHPCEAKPEQSRASSMEEKLSRTIV